MGFDPNTAAPTRETRPLKVWLRAEHKRTERDKSHSEKFAEVTVTPIKAPDVYRARMLHHDLGLIIRNPANALFPVSTCLGTRHYTNPVAAAGDLAIACDIDQQRKERETK